MCKTPIILWIANAAAPARSAAVKVAKSMECCDAAQSAWKTAKAALDLFRSDGHLNDRSWAQARVAEALATLAGGAWTTVRNRLQARAAFTSLDRLHAQLSQLPISPELRAALVRLGWLRHRSRGKPGVGGSPVSGKPGVCREARCLSGSPGRVALGVAPQSDPARISLSRSSSSHRPALTKLLQFLGRSTGHGLKTRSLP